MEALMKADSANESVFPWIQQGCGNFPQPFLFLRFPLFAKEQKIPALKGKSGLRCLYDFPGFLNPLVPKSFRR